MRFSIGGINVYITRYRMKRRGKVDDVRRKSRARVNRVKRREYVRTGGLCAVCGNHYPLDALQVHHVKPVSEFPRLIARAGNIQLLCAECHTSIHGKGKEAEDVRG